MAQYTTGQTPLPGGKVDLYESSADQSRYWRAAELNQLRDALQEILTDPGPLPVTATGSTTARALKDRASDVVNVKDFGAKGDGTTDDTAAIQAALNAASTAGGGVVYFPVGTYVVLGQVTFPNSGATLYRQKQIRMIGAGATADGTGITTTTPNGGTILDMRYSGTYGKLLTLGAGLLEITGITFTDTAGDSLPFIYTTATTLHIHDAAFFGSKTGTACDQDAIILGGTNSDVLSTGDPTNGFQGYGTVIRQNHFKGIRRAVYGRTYANSVVVDSNNVWRGSGSNLADGAAIEFDGTGTGVTQGFSRGNTISNNLIEASAYPYGVKLTALATYNHIVGNSCWDTGQPPAANIACVYFPAPGSDQNIVIPGYTDKPGVQTYLKDLGTNNMYWAQTLDHLSVGAIHTAANGDVLHLSAGTTADMVYQEFYPRSASPNTRYGWIGFGSAGTSTMTIQSDVLNLQFNAPNSHIDFLRATIPAYSVQSPAPGTITIDPRQASTYLFNWGTASGAWTIAFNGAGAYANTYIDVIIKNTSGGAVTTVWSGSAHLTAAWTDPANGKNRAIRLFTPDGAIWYEVSRSTADVTN